MDKEIILRTMATFGIAGFGIGKNLFSDNLPALIASTVTGMVIGVTYDFFMYWVKTRTPQP